MILSLLHANAYLEILVNKLLSIAHTHNRPTMCSRCIRRGNHPCKDSFCRVPSQSSTQAEDFFWQPAVAANELMKSMHSMEKFHAFINRMPPHVSSVRAFFQGFSNFLFDNSIDFVMRRALGTTQSHQGVWLHLKDLLLIIRQQGSLDRVFFLWKIKRLVSGGGGGAQGR